MWVRPCESPGVPVRVGVLVAATLPTLLWVTPAAATEPPLAISLDFRGEAGCSSQQAFLDKVRARVAFVLAEAPQALRLEVTLTRTPDGSQGHLRSGSGDSDARELEARTCDEVADALALITALVIERTQREQAAKPDQRIAVMRPIASPALVPKRAARTHIALGAQAQATRVLDMAPLLGAGLGLWVDAGLSWGLSAQYARNDLLGEPSRARVAFGSVTFAVGPRSLELAPRLRLAGTVATQGGFVAADGVSVDVSTSARRSYWAFGLLARLQLQATSRGFAYLALAGFVPLIERRFRTLEPERQVASTVKVAPEVALGFALTL